MYLDTERCDAHPRLCVVVEPARETQVLEPGCVAHSAFHETTGGGEAGTSREQPGIVAAVLRRQRHPAHPFEYLDDRRRGVEQLPGGSQRVPAPQRVLDPQFDPVHAEDVGQLVHLRLVTEAGLHGAEPAHRPARRVVGLHRHAIDGHRVTAVGGPPRDRRRFRSPSCWSTGRPPRR